MILFAGMGMYESPQLCIMFDHICSESSLLEFISFGIYRQCHVQYTDSQSFPHLLSMPYINFCLAKNQPTSKL